MPAHGDRMEGEGEPSAEAVQSHIYTRWTRLLGGWTSGFGAALYGCASGLPGQDARQRGGRSRCSFTQGPEERNGPGPAHQQSHRPGHQAVNVQPGGIGTPSVAHFDGFTEAQKSSQAMRHFLPKCDSSAASSRTKTALTQQPTKPKPATPEPLPPKNWQDRGRSHSARRYPFPKRQGPRVSLPPDHPASSL